MKKRAVIESWQSEISKITQEAKKLIKQYPIIATRPARITERLKSLIKQKNSYENAIQNSLAGQGNVQLLTQRAEDLKKIASSRPVSPTPPSPKASSPRSASPKPVPTRPTSPTSPKPAVQVTKAVRAFLDGMKVAFAKFHTDLTTQKARILDGDIAKDLNVAGTHNKLLNLFSQYKSVAAKTTLNWADIRPLMDGLEGIKSDLKVLTTKLDDIDTELAAELEDSETPKSSGSSPSSASPGSSSPSSSDLLTPEDEQELVFPSIPTKPIQVAPTPTKSDKQELVFPAVPTKPIKMTPAPTKSTIHKPRPTAGMSRPSASSFTPKELKKIIKNLPKQEEKSHRRLAEAQSGYSKVNHKLDQQFDKLDASTNALLQGGGLFSPPSDQVDHLMRVASDAAKLSIQEKQASKQADEALAARFATLKGQTFTR